MRRKEREVTGREGMLSIFQECPVLRVAYQDGQGLAVVPLNFGLTWDGALPTLYFHSAKEGRKARAFAQGCSVAFELDCGHQLVTGERACSYTYHYRSLMGAGSLRPVTAPEEKELALTAVMDHYAKGPWEFSPEMLERVSLFAIDVTQLTGKQNQ